MKTLLERMNQKDLESLSNYIADFPTLGVRLMQSLETKTYVSDLALSDLIDLSFCLGRKTITEFVLDVWSHFPNE
jgi:hypothetical protein